jgi:sugar lactone lactonase YvrE
VVASRKDWLSVALKTQAVSVSRGTFIRALLAAGASAPAFPLQPAVAATGTLFVTSPNLFPENLAYLETADLFYVGSLRYGRVSSVNANGKITTLCDDPRLISTFGIFADRAGSLIYACNADVGVSVRSRPSRNGRICGLATIDARSGTLVRYIDIIGSEPGRHLPNDGAIASDGSIYVTDTLAPVIHRVSKDGHPEVFVSNADFGANAPAPGLDGIAIASSGTIVANHISGGKLFRIDPSTKAVSQVIVDGGVLLKGCDGMRFERDGRLMVTQGTLAGPSRNALCALSSTDDWKTATVSHVWPLSATTYQSVRTKTGVYGVQSQLERLFHNPKDVHVPGFRVTRISA